jgi:nucleoside-diphosphate-sugar epimerase
MKALVTGAAGFIGSHLSAVLAARGFDVVGLDCFTDYYGRDLKEANLATLADTRQFRFVEGALQTVDLGALLDGVTHIFHLAAQAGVRRSWGAEFSVYTSHNVEATQRLLEAVKTRNLARFVYASSSSVYGDLVAIPMREESALHPVSPYGVTKLAAEHLCYLYYVNYGVPTVSLRYFTVYGPRQRPDMAFHKFLRAALTGQPIAIYGDGEQTRDFTFVADAASATATAGDRGRPGAVYNIGGGSRVTLNSVLDRLVGITGRSLDIRREDPQKGDMRDTFADTTRALEDLDFRPTYTLDAGLTAEYEWLAASLKGSRR